MNQITIIEKRFTRQELVNAQKKINNENNWASAEVRNAEKQIDNLLRKVNQ